MNDENFNQLCHATAHLSDPIIAFNNNFEKKIV
jgi:hypothetical protein